ncbi:MAG: polysaccharide pyruvyl transferase family protein [Bacilli bacterium]|nr:polysaccharide pyruvyl transferase family protein [Bacilli bacterium]
MNNRICLVTYYNTLNYGTSLQAYALQKTICNLGFECQILKNIPISPLDNFQNHKNVNTLFRLKALIVKIVFFRKNKEKVHNFLDFCKENFSFCNYDLLNENDLKEINNRFNVFLVGSDQSWNPVSGQRQKSFLLDFVNEKNNKSAYGPSFGVQELPERFEKYYSEKLNKFSFLSTREESGIRIIEKLTGKEASLVLDPVFLLSRNEWDNLSSGNDLYSNYILCYFLGGDKSIRNSAKKYAKKNNLKIVFVCCNTNDYGFNTKNKKRVFPSIASFLILLKKSCAVFTDSYHGFCLSIIFNKEVFVSLRFDNSDCFSENGRILSLVNLLDFPIERVFLKNKCSYEAVKKCKPIRYSSILDKVDKNRERSILYLKQALLYDKNKQR